MTIIYLRDSVAAYEGLERIFIYKANYMAEIYGYTVYLITSGEGGHPAAYEISSKVKHVDLGFPFFRNYKYRILKRFVLDYQMQKRFNKKLQEFVNSVHADIIIGTTGDYHSITAMNLLGCNVKTIVESHNTRFSVESHIAKFSINKKVKDIKNPIIKWAFKKKNKRLYSTIRNASKFVTLTNGDAKDWSDITQAAVIPNSAYCYSNVTCDTEKKGKRVITAGRLTQQKGYDMLLDAWYIVHKKHSDWYLDIYGDGEDELMLLEKRRALHLDETIIFHQPTSDIYNKYKESDFYVMSSRWEGFGMVLLEAMSCGIPCISFNCDYGPADIIKDEEDGILVEKTNTLKLAEAICYLIEHEDIRLKMGEEARKNVTRYLPENIMPKWDLLFKNLVP